ncbi:MAG: hypothetical protein K8T26_06405 [Lentisphaerae bacterium]|nr:hypothetical protein [Lentisphaerota bacterium]
MHPTSSPPNPDLPATAATRLYHCGTLSYTRAGLFALFAWLLWGNFCFQIMESVVPSILPLTLKDLGCSNWLMGLILTTAPGVLNMTVCPYVSFRSDRYRSKWGRRIPFIIGTLPFLCLSLVLIGLSHPLSAWLHQHALFLSHIPPASITIALIAAFLICFQFFNMFVASVFFYLFNDVVPARFLARFMGVFGIVGTGASAFYNFFVFKYAESHMQEIFLGAAALYFVGFGLTCLNVKEGSYPPPEGESEQAGRGWQGVATFFRESFTHKFYWYRFLATGFAAAGGAIGTFTVFFNREMGLSLDQIGKIAAIGSIAMMAAMYCMAIFVDRWHPLRITVYGALFGVLGSLMSLVWVFITLPGPYFFWLNVGNVIINAFLSALVGTASLPCEMRVFPQSRFGQFCSSQAMLRSVFTVVFGILAGLFIDLVRRLCHGSDFAYRFIHVWGAVFSAISAAFLVRVYLFWHQMGGDRHFNPPAPWSAKGVEEMPAVPIIGPQSKWMKLAFLTFDGVMVVSVCGALGLMGVMAARHQTVALRGFALWVLPGALLGWWAWLAVKRGIRRDMAAAAIGGTLRNGLPHHGMLMVLGSKFLLAAGIWVCQVASAMVLNLERGAVVFGVANGITNLLLVGTVLLMCRIERGYSTTIDERLANA